MLPHFQIKIRLSKNVIANKTQNMSSKLQYASLYAANYVMVKRVIAERGVIADAKRQTQRNAHSKFWDSHITGKLPLSENYVTQANTLMAPRCKGEQRRASQCSRHVYRLDLLLRQHQNVKLVQA